MFSPYHCHLCIVKALIRATTSASPHENSGCNAHHDHCCNKCAGNDRSISAGGGHASSLCGDILINGRPAYRQHNASQQVLMVQNTRQLQVSAFCRESMPVPGQGSPLGNNCFAMHNHGFTGLCFTKCRIGYNTILRRTLQICPVTH